jgi:hypothetical protein
MANSLSKGCLDSRVKVLKRTLFLRRNWLWVKQETSSTSQFVGFLQLKCMIMYRWIACTRIHIYIYTVKFDWFCDCFAFWSDLALHSDLIWLNRAQQQHECRNTWRVCCSVFRVNKIKAACERSCSHNQWNWHECNARCNPSNVSCKLPALPAPDEISAAPSETPAKIMGSCADKESKGFALHRASRCSSIRKTASSYLKRNLTFAGSGCIRSRQQRFCLPSEMLMVYWNHN